MKFIVVPGPVMSLIAHPKFTFMLLTWNPPREPNGVITRYEVIYRLGARSPVTVNAGLNTSYTIASLQPQTAISEVTVIAYNRKGQGESITLTGLLTLPAPRKYVYFNFNIH